MTKKQILTLAQASVLTALILLLTFVPSLGYINIGLLSITTIHIPVIVGACLMGPFAGMLLGSVWGISSWVYAMINPAVPSALLFMDPLISVLPRIIVGLVAGFLFIWFEKLTQKLPLRCLLTAICATLTNTVLVLSGIIFLAHPLSELGNAFKVFVTAALAINVPVEIVSACIITIGAVTAIKKAKLA